jgi:hypothetical protein
MPAGLWLGCVTGESGGAAGRVGQADIRVRVSLFDPCLLYDQLWPDDSSRHSPHPFYSWARPSGGTYPNLTSGP